MPTNIMVRRSSTPDSEYSKEPYMEFGREENARIAKLIDCKIKHAGTDISPKMRKFHHYRLVEHRLSCK